MADNGFLTHNWDADERWQEELAKMEFNGSKNSSRYNVAIYKRKKRYFKEYISDDFDMEFEKYTQDSKSDNSDEAQQQQQQQSQTQNSAPPRQQPRSKLDRRLVIGLNYCRLVLILAVVFFSFMFVVSGAASVVYWKRVFQASALSSLLNICLTYGMPSLSKQYFQALVFDEAAHFLLYPLPLYTEIPFFLGIAPLLIRSVISGCIFARALLNFSILAPFKSKLNPFLSYVIQQEPLTRNLVPQIEIGNFIVLLLRVFSPYRSIFGIVFFFQYLRMRYILSGSMRIAFTSIRVTLDSYLFSPRCPGIISKIYQGICALLYKTVDTSSMQQNASAMPKCTIL